MNCSIRPGICIKLRIIGLYDISSERRSHRTMFVPTPQAFALIFHKIILDFQLAWKQAVTGRVQTNLWSHHAFISAIIKDEACRFPFDIIFEKAEFKDNISLAWKLSSLLFIGEPSNTNGYFGALVEFASFRLLVQFKWHQSLCDQSLMIGSWIWLWNDLE